MRAEADFDVIPPGACFTDAVKGRLWIFIGWSANTAGNEMVFARAILPQDGSSIPYLYHASMTETLIRKFPNLRYALKGKPRE